jgi:hypothetical protein
MCEDLSGRTEAEIAHACKRWRTSPERYFPTSGQLLELMRNPYETRGGRVYDPIAPIEGPFITPERAREVLRAAGFKTVSDAQEG